MKIKEEGLHEKSDEFIEIVEVIYQYLKYIKSTIFYDCHALFIKKESTDFITEFILFLNDIIINPLTNKTSVLALEIVVNLLQELTEYEDEVIKERKLDQMGIYSNK